MRSYVCLTALVLLYVYLPVKSNVLECTVAKGACGYKNENFYNENCEGKKKHFDCLIKHGCSKSDDIYEQDYEALSYGKCENGGTTAVISWSLSFLSILITKLSNH